MRIFNVPEYVLIIFDGNHRESTVICCELTVANNKRVFNCGFKMKNGLRVSIRSRNYKRWNCKFRKAKLQKLLINCDEICFVLNNNILAIYECVSKSYTPRLGRMYLFLTSACLHINLPTSFCNTLHYLYIYRDLFI